MALADAMRGRGVAQGRGASFAKKSTASRLGRWLKLPTKTSPRRLPNDGVKGHGYGYCGVIKAWIEVMSRVLNLGEGWGWSWG